jgi:hypothetical protein
VRAPFFLVQQRLPILSKGSSIVFVSSLAARAVLGTIPAYAATKGAIDTMTKHFASLLGERGVRVNAVAPGVVETEMSNFTKSENERNSALGMQTLKRIAQPDDIGGVVAFLVYEETRWITGDIIHVDGGSSFGPGQPHVQSDQSISGRKAQTRSSVAADGPPSSQTSQLRSLFIPKRYRPHPTKSFQPEHEAYGEPSAGE